jgi:hypothetical protein
MPEEFSRGCDIAKLHKHMEYELKRQGITVGKLNFDEGSDNEGMSLSYVYEPASREGLDFSFVAIEDEFSFLQIGPIGYELDNERIATTEQSVAEALVNVIQLLLNGQYAVVVTESTKSGTWQAAELVWQTKKGQQYTIATLPHYEFLRQKLTARILRNHELTGSYSLPSGHFMQPENVDGNTLGRQAINLDAPTPLDKKTFKGIDNQLAIMLMGGGENDSMWDLFYRRTEFWLITVVLVSLYVWVDEKWFSGDGWVDSVVSPFFAIVTGSMVIFLTAAALGWRQRQIDKGQRPLFEPLEKVLPSRGLAVLVTIAVGYVFWFRPIWTTREHPQVLLNAFQVPEVQLYVSVGLLLMFGSIAILRSTSRRDRLVRFLSYLVGYGILLYANFFVLYGGDGAAVASDIDTVMLLLIPLATIIWLGVVAFKKLPDQSSNGRSWDGVFIS